jgi:DNA-binding NarL/FixJ family response regulator/uncharacterized protein YbdZ (MbtH family)
MNNDEPDRRSCRVVVRDEKRYPTWLADRDLPADWPVMGTDETHDVCLAHIGVGVVTSECDPLVRAGIQAVLQRDRTVEVITEARERPQVLVIAGPVGELPGLISRFPGSWLAGIVVVTGDIDAGQCKNLASLGVRGLVHRAGELEELVHAVHAVARNRGYVAGRHAAAVLGALCSCPQADQLAEGAAAARLTPRERDVFSYVCRGMANREIAQALAVSEKTVKFHVSNILSKTGLRTRGQLMASVAGN